MPLKSIKPLTKCCTRNFAYGGELATGSMFNAKSAYKRSRVKKKQNFLSIFIYFFRTFTIFHHEPFLFLFLLTRCSNIGLNDCIRIIRTSRILVSSIAHNRCRIFTVPLCHTIRYKGLPEKSGSSDTRCCGRGQMILKKGKSPQLF